MGSYSMDRSSEFTPPQCSLCARPCSQHLRDANSFKAHYKQPLEVRLLSPFCSKENLPNVTQRVIGESGFAPGVGALSFLVVHSLHKATTIKCFQYSGSKYDNSKYDPGDGQKVLQKPTLPGWVEDVSTGEPFLSWPLKKEFTRSKGHFRPVWTQQAWRARCVQLASVCLLQKCSP